MHDAELLSEMSWSERLWAVILAGLSIWYWPSPWPVIVALVYVMYEAWLRIRRLLLHAAVGSASRPMHMRWSLSVWLTDRAWESLGVETERQPDLERRLGTLERGVVRYLFENEPTPRWVSNELRITFEAWGESLERWRVWQSPNSDPINVQESIPAIEGLFPGIVDLWPPHEPSSSREEERIGLFFRYEDASLVVGNPSSGAEYGEPTKILFEIPAPTAQRRHWAWEAKDGIAANELDQFATVYSRDELLAGVERQPTHEFFTCIDREKGFRWNMHVNDLRHWLDGRVVGVSRRGVFRRKVIAYRIRLDDSGIVVTAGPQAITPSLPGGPTVPQKGDYVQVVCEDGGQVVDRVWLYSLSLTPSTEEGNA